MPFVLLRMLVTHGVIGRLVGFLVSAAFFVACGADSESPSESSRVLVAPSTASPTTASPTTTTVPPTTSTLVPNLLQDGIPRVLRTSTGAVAPVLETVDLAHLIRTPCQDIALVLDGEVSERVHVVLDPGHGGEEAGGVTTDGLAEKDINLRVASIAGVLLENLGFEITLTRYVDIRVPLVTRVEIAEAAEAELLVSIHHQGTDPDVPRSATPGTEVYYQQDSSESKRFAGLLWEEAVSELDLFEIEAWFAGTDAGATYRLDRDTGEDFYGMVRRPSMPAVLVEMSFLGNPAEVELLRTRDFLLAEARAISQAVVRWFTTDDPGSGFVEPSFSLRSSGGGGGTSGCVDPDLGDSAPATDAQRSRVLATDETSLE